MEENLLSPAEEGNLEEIIRLVEQGVNVNQQDIYGSTAVSLASTNDNLDVVDYLVGVGANLNIKDENEETALADVIKNGNDRTTNGHNNEEGKEIRLSLIRKMIANGADIGIIGPQNFTSLHYAVLSFPEAIPDLIKFGADLNTKKESGETPMKRAICHDRVKSVKFLLENASDYYYSHQGELFLLPGYKSTDREKIDQLIDLFLRKHKFINIRSEFGGYFSVLPLDLGILIAAYL